MMQINQQQNFAMLQNMSTSMPVKSKKSWTAIEDSQLLQLVIEYGGMNWSKIAEGLDGRTAKQCRERYHNHLQPHVKKGEWTPEEDTLIVEMQSNLGNQWAKIAKMLPGRTDNAVKNRWHAAVRSIGRNSAAQLSPEIPVLKLGGLLHNDDNQSIATSITSPSLNLTDIEDSSTSLTSFGNGESTRDNVLWQLQTESAYAHDHAHSHAPSSGRTCSFSPSVKMPFSVRKPSADITRGPDTARSTISFISNISDCWNEDAASDVQWFDDENFTLMVFTPRSPDYPFSPMRSPLKRTPRSALSPEEQIMRKLRRFSSDNVNLDASIFVTPMTNDNYAQHQSLAAL